MDRAPEFWLRLGIGLDSFLIVGAVVARSTFAGLAKTQHLRSAAGNRSGDQRYRIYRDRNFILVDLGKPDQAKSLKALHELRALAHHRCTAHERSDRIATSVKARTLRRSAR